MATQNTIFLHEEVMLLALRDVEGTIAPGTMSSVRHGRSRLG